MFGPFIYLPGHLDTWPFRHLAIYTPDTYISSRYTSQDISLPHSNNVHDFFVPLRFYKTEFLRKVLMGLLRYHPQFFRFIKSPQQFPYLCA